MNRAPNKMLIPQTQAAHPELVLFFVVLIEALTASMRTEG
jgi:hypothetical protein